MLHHQRGTLNGGGAPARPPAVGCRPLVIHSGARLVEVEPETRHRQLPAGTRWRK